MYRIVSWVARKFLGVTATDVRYNGMRTLSWYSGKGYWVEAETNSKFIGFLRTAWAVNKHGRANAYGR